MGLDKININAYNCVNITRRRFLMLSDMVIIPEDVAKAITNAIENAAGDDKEVENPSYDFDKDFHRYRV